MSTPPAPQKPASDPVDEPLGGRTPRSAEYLESMLWSMVVGAIWVPFVRWPLALLSFVSDTPQAAVRIFRITAAGLALLAVIALPSIYIWQFDVVNTWAQENGMLKFYDWVTANSGLVTTLCVAWTTITALGSLSAAWYFRRLMEDQDDDFV